jgi:hypothetical protein
VICQGEDRSPSTVQRDPLPGAGVQRSYQYLWDFDDGTVDSTSGPIASHAFPDDGEHVVQLLTIIGRQRLPQSLNLVDLHDPGEHHARLQPVRPSARRVPSGETCFGETVSRSMATREPVTWTANARRQLRRGHLPAR